MPYENLQNEIGGLKVPVYSWANHPLSSDEHTMIRNVTKLPCIYKHVALMPDAHLGKGAMVGSVVATKNAVIPACVGVDVGCGMMAVHTGYTSEVLDGELKALRSQIEKVVPVGFSQYDESVDLSSRWNRWADFEDLHEGVQDRKAKAMKQLGTLGGGNHFIEICLDTEDNVWIMLHSGSRNIGKELAERHINTAKSLHRLSDLPDPDLAYFIFGTEEFKNYWKDLRWAQDYAMMNRKVMMSRVMNAFTKVIGVPVKPEMSVNCHHNYVAEETHYEDKVFVTRKGAIEASEGTLGIIPGSMGAKSFIVRGRGNPESFNSCSHGAGRRMSRGQAKRQYTVEDLERQTEGIECRKDLGVLDEIPKAYKSIETVMKNQSDLVEVVAELKQVICIKG